MAREMKSYEEEQAIIAKQLKSDTRSITWVDSDECLYRGRKIRRYDSVPTGYWGRYSVRVPSSVSAARSVSMSKMSEAKAFIDKMIADKAAAEATAAQGGA